MEEVYSRCVISRIHCFFFDGIGYPSVEQWVEEFEENVVTVKWNSLQKFVYGKQLLRGVAKLFIRSQTGAGNWSALKDSLLQEFGSHISPVEVHQPVKSP